MSHDASSGDGPPRAAALAAAYQAARAERAGQVAAYIPELARVEPELFGLAICSPEGEVLALGDAEVEITLQSVSKPFVYAGALARLGLEAVHQRVGVEPTGDAFDSIIRLEQNTHRPHNPMINAGAIAITGLLVEHGVGIDELLELLGRFAGRPLAVDLPTYLSERSTGHRNRAIAYLLRHFGMLRAPVDAILDLYFQQCSIAVTCRDLAVMAATLANRGRHPQTAEQVLPAELVRPVLTVMYTAGLYDESGRFAFEVGLPAKSGVSGDILAVAPGRLGLAAVSPRLDERGNSVRGQVAMRHLSRALGLHLFNHPAPPTARRAAPARTALEKALADALAFARSQPAEGDVARYIPHLAKVDPDLLALALCTVDGDCLAVGDHAVPFTLQSAANPFTYAAVVEAVGSEAVHRAIGVEPSGNPFHEIVFDHHAASADGGHRRNRPPNPLANAGAIALCGMMPGHDATARLLRLLDVFALVGGGRRLTVDAGVLQAEKSAGDRNRAIASLLRNFGWIADEEAALELYWQQCSLRADTRTLANLGATLANGGQVPNGQRAFAATTVRDTLSLMSTCGLHDESGHFAFDVGLPAKSGISGCLLAIVPGYAAIAAYAPPVNHAGTSPRARAAVQRLAQNLQLGVFG